ncbi:MAG: hypothetical protein Q4D21_05050 [Phascolarctobacterium sp.]|nr:hypothetical protein [Phascolarctobacterium sp.]
MKKTLLIASALLSFSLSCFASTYTRLNEFGMPTGFLYTVETTGMGTYMEFQVTDANPEVAEQVDVLWKKSPRINCAGQAGNGEVSFRRVIIANEKTNSKGEFIDKLLPYAGLSYKYSTLSNGNLRVYPIYADGREWKAVVDLTGEYVLSSERTTPSENMLITFLGALYPEYTRGMFKDKKNKISAKLLIESKDRKKYPDIAENLDESYSLKVTDRATEKTVEFVGDRCCRWVYRIEEDGRALAIYNQNGVG